MWILPKQLISAFAQDTEALTLDSVELSQTCAQSLMRRSKPSPAKTYLREWKAGNLMRLRSGAISSHFLGQSFLGWWTFSLAATRVSHSAQPGSDLEHKTQGIFGPTSQAAFDFFDQSSVSSRTSKDTLPLDSEKSLENWKSLVIKRRLEYSARLNAARLTSESECLSWPTCAARDWKGTSPGYLTRSDGKSRVDQLPVAVDQAEAGNWPTPTVQEAGKIGNQANHGQLALSNHPALRGEVTREKFEKGKHGLPAQGNHSTHGNRPESWATPEGMAGGKISRGGKRKGELLLTGQVKAWATPAGRDWKDNGTTQPPSIGETRGFSLGQQMVTTPTPGKLNSRWVETLMGLPIGWTMPSCASPVTIGQTSCAYLATE